jgi:hypothetical protein
MLDNQIKVSNQMMSAFGTMTNVEKKLNRADLLAYKSYDNTNYSLVQGLNHAYNKKSMATTKAHMAGEDFTAEAMGARRSTSNLNISMDVSRA